MLMIRVLQDGTEWIWQVHCGSNNRPMSRSPRPYPTERQANYMADAHRIKLKKLGVNMEIAVRSGHTRNGKLNMKTTYPEDTALLSRANKRIINSDFGYEVIYGD